MKKRKIVSICLSGGDIPKGKHCTLIFKPRGNIRDNMVARLGETVKYEETLILKNERVCCVVLFLEDMELYHGKSQPHVTVECFGDAKPVESNDLIDSTDLSAMSDSQELTVKEAIISAMYYDKSGKQYSTSSVDWE